MLHNTVSTHLTRGSKAGAFEDHRFAALEGNDRVQSHPRAFQPTVGQKPRLTAIDLFALGFGPAPPLVLAAGPRGVADHHEAVLAFVGDDRLVRHGGVHGLAVDGAVRDGALHGHAGGQFGRGPGPVALAIPGVFAH